MDDRERIYVKAMDRYWNDAEFHARCKLAFQLLDHVEQAPASIFRQLIIAVHIGSLPIEELIAPATQTVIESFAPPRSPEPL